MSIEDVKQLEQARRQFTETMVERLQGATKNYSQLETLPPDPRDLGIIVCTCT